MLIFDPNLGEEKIKTLITKIEDKIKSLGGEITKTDNWGSKRLANTFQKARKMVFGVYVVVFFKALSGLPVQLTGYLKVTEDLARYSVYRAEELPAEPAEEKPAEKKEEAKLG
jgi:small subunit ribosomal protein S6